MWRHLRNNPGSNIKIADADIMHFLLELLKAMYGLVDGPLLFQLALLHYLTQIVGMRKSVHDENFLFFTQGWDLFGLMVIHVGDRSSGYRRHE